MAPVSKLPGCQVSRSFVIFLLFVAVLASGAGALLWWAGPAKVSLALDDERRSSPYYLIHLLDQPDPAAYFQSFGALLREEGAQLLWRGSLQALRAGRSRDELADVALLEFSEGSGVVQMLTSSGYRALTKDRLPVLLGTPEAPGPIVQDETLLLWLVELKPGVAPEVLEAPVQAATARGGQLVWSTPVAVLEGQRSWNHAVLLAFPSSRAVTTWLEDPQTVTERSLARRYYDGEAMLEVRSG
ncbi:MAG TPA: hypothetical protein VIS76_11340 [Pseudomonadales bacterium]